MAARISVNVEPLDHDNYGVWSVRMRYYLMHHDLWRHVDPDHASIDTAASSGSEEEAPAAAAVASEAGEGPERALAIIGLCVRPWLLHVIEESRDARGAWTALRDLFRSKSVARRLVLRRQLAALRKSSKETIAQFLGRARTLRNELARVGAPPSEEDMITAVLAALPKEYDTVTTVLGVTESIRTLDAVLPHLLQVEQRGGGVGQERSHGGGALMASGNGNGTGGAGGGTFGRRNRHRGGRTSRTGGASAAQTGVEGRRGAGGAHGGRGGGNGRTRGVRPESLFCPNPGPRAYYSGLVAYYRLCCSFTGSMPAVYGAIRARHSPV